MLSLFVLAGFAVMIYTAYLIYYVETPAINRVWNPYDILGISEVCAHASNKHPLLLPPAC